MNLIFSFRGLASHIKIKIKTKENSILTNLCNVSILVISITNSLSLEPLDNFSLHFVFQSKKIENEEKFLDEVLMGIEPTINWI